MPLYSHTGNIFQADVQMAVVWLHSGFASVDISWKEFRDSHTIRVEPQRTPLAGEPWHEMDVLMWAAPIAGAGCRWVYALNTNSDSQGYAALADVAEATRRALGVAKDLRPSSAGIMHIRYSPDASPPTLQNQEQSAQAMVDAAANWTADGEHPDLDIVFCDLRGAFSHLAPGWRA